MPVFHVTSALKAMGVEVCWLQRVHMMASSMTIMLLNSTQGLMRGNHVPS
jgi:hypothetical protein